MTPEQQDLLEKADKKLASAKVSLREGFPEDAASKDVLLNVLRGTLSVAWRGLYRKIP